jgi:hypothetical protein
MESRLMRIWGWVLLIGGLDRLGRYRLPVDGGRSHFPADCRAKQEAAGKIGSFAVRKI